MKKIYIALFLSFTIVGLTPAQNVGIGTTTPGEKLDVDGNVTVRGGELFFENTHNSGLQLQVDGANNLFQVLDGGSAAGVLAGSIGIDNTYATARSNLSTLGGNSLAVKDHGYFGGNVGIGTTSLSEKLVVGGDVQINGSGGTIGIATLANGWLKIGSNLAFDNNEIMFGGIEGNFGTVDAYSLRLITNGTTRMTINSAGSVSLSSGTGINEFSTDGTLGGNSDNALPTEQAVKEYVDNQIASVPGPDNLGNHTATTTLNMNGNDIDMVRGNTSSIKSLGEISFDWTSGTYDHPSYHGIQSRNEAGDLGDELRINSYNDIINTIDANNNDATSYFKVQTHSNTNGADLFWVESPSGNANIQGRLRFANNNTGELYLSGSRIHARSEGVDGVAQFASYGMYLPRTGQTYNLYLGGKLKVGHGESGYIDINDASTRIGEGSGNALRLQTNSGYIDVGAQNSSWAHLQTDRANFYFNRAIHLGTGVLSSYSTNNLSLQTGGVTRMTLEQATGDVGIGTTNPLYMLDVRGDARFNYDNGNFDFVIEGQTEPTVFMVDASRNAVQLAGSGGTAGQSYMDIYKFSSTKNYGIWAYHRKTSAGSGYGIYGSVGTTNTSAYVYGLYGRATPAGGRGYGVYGTTSGSGLRYGGYFAGTTYSTGGYQSSDKKLKRNIQPYESALKSISSLNPVTYSYRTDEYPFMNLEEGQHVGLIAQELEEVFPQLVKTTYQPTERIPLEEARENGYEYKATETEGIVEVGEEVEFKAVNYTNLIPVLIKGIQEQQEMIEAIKKENEALRIELDQLKAGN